MSKEQDLSNKIQNIEETFKNLDIVLSENDRVMLWLQKANFTKLHNEVYRREQEKGEYWHGPIMFYAHSYKDWYGVMCEGVSYKRVLSLIEELELDFEVGRVLYRMRKLLPNTAPKGRGSFLLEVPQSVRARAIGRD